MRIKNLLIVLLLSAIVVLGACSKDDGDSSSEWDNKITILQSKVEISEQLEELAKIYEEETGVKVEVWGTTGDDYFSQLQVRLNSNQGPSIMTLQNVMTARQIESYIYDLSNEDMVKNLAPNMSLELDGKIVGIPYGIEGFGLVYNKDLISPEDITDYDSFVNKLKEFKDEGINGLLLSSEAYFLIGHILNWPFSLQDDHVEFIDKLNNGEVTMAETPEFQEFAKFMEAIREYTVNPLDMTYDRQVGDFATGKAAMIHQGNWVMGVLGDYEYDFEIGMLPLPLNGNDKLEVGLGGNWGVNAKKSEEEIKAAIDFLDWMHNSEIGQKYIVEEFGFVPAMTNIEASGLDPLSQAVLDASNSGKAIQWAHNDFPSDIIPNVLAPATEEFFLDDSLTGEDLLKLLDEAWQSAQE